MTSPTPDLSPAALALAFRQEATARMSQAHAYDSDGLHHAATTHRQRAAYLESLADALDGQGMTAKTGDWGDCAKCGEQVNHEDDPNNTGLCLGCR